MEDLYKKAKENMLKDEKGNFYLISMCENLIVYSLIKI